MNSHNKKCSRGIFAVLFSFAVIFAFALTFSQRPVFADRSVHAETTDTQTSANVAEVAGTEYGSISAALSSITGSEQTTITLIANTNENVTIGSAQNIVLDLNGHTLTNVSGHTITNNGKLVITDSSENKEGLVDNITHGMAALCNNAGAELTITAGSFTRSLEDGAYNNQGTNSYYVILNQGTMVIGESGESDENIKIYANGTYSSLIENGWYTPANNKTGLVSTITIYNGTFTGGLNTLKNDDYGYATIYGGLFNGAYQHEILNYNVITIEGGTFDGTESTNGYTIYTTNDSATSIGQLTINGGEFISERSYALYQGKGTVTITGGTFTSPSGKNNLYRNSSLGVTSVSGGEFSTAIALTYLADGSATVENIDDDGRVYYTIESADDYPVYINKLFYPSVAAAIEAAQDGNTICFARDVSEAVVIPVGKTVKLNLMGHTLSSSNHVLTVNGTVSISNGTLCSTLKSKYIIYGKSGSVINITGNLSVIREVSTLNSTYSYIDLTSSTFSVTGDGNVFGNADYAYSTSNPYLIKQTNSTISLGGSAVYYGGNDSSSSSAYLIYSNSNSSYSSNITITGGTFYASTGFYNIPKLGNFAISISSGNFNTFVGSDIIVPNFVCYYDGAQYHVVEYSALPADLGEGLVSGSATTEFEWESIASGYAYISEKGTFTVVSADDFQSWAIAQIEEEYAWLVSHQNYSDAMLAQLEAYANAGYKIIISEAVPGTLDGNVKIQKAMYSAIADINTVPTYNSELASAVNNAVSELKLYAIVKGVSFSDELAAPIQQAGSVGEVSAALENAKLLIDESIAAEDASAAKIKLRINSETLNWEVSYDDGETWESLGVKAVTDTNENDEAAKIKLRINSETLYWEVSYDDGETWESLGFKAVTDEENSATDVNYSNTISSSSEARTNYEFALIIIKLASLVIECVFVVLILMVSKKVTGSTKKS